VWSVRQGSGCLHSSIDEGSAESSARSSAVIDAKRLIAYPPPRAPSSGRSSGTAPSAAGTPVAPGSVTQLSLRSRDSEAETSFRSNRVRVLARQIQLFEGSVRLRSCGVSAPRRFHLACLVRGTAFSGQRVGPLAHRRHTASDCFVIGESTHPTSSGYIIYVTVAKEKFT
jgi:hypothetical protein